MKLKNCNAGFYVFLTFPEDFSVFLIFNYSDTTCFMKVVSVTTVMSPVPSSRDCSRLCMSY